MLSVDPSLPTIQLFDKHHLLYLGLFVLLLSILLGYRSTVRKKRRILSKLFLSVMLFQQLLLYGYYLVFTGFDIGDALPLHICRISSLTGILYLITKKSFLMDITFYFGLYAYGSFLYPSQISPIYHALGLSFFLSHASVLLLPYFAYFAEDWRPNKKYILKIYLIFLAYLALVNWLNPMINGNYFYLTERPFLHQMPDYLYIILIVGFTLTIFVSMLALVRTGLEYIEKKQFRSSFRKHQ